MPVRFLGEGATVMWSSYPTEISQLQGCFALVLEVLWASFYVKIFTIFRVGCLRGAPPNGIISVTYNILQTWDQ